MLPLLFIFIFNNLYLPIYIYVYLYLTSFEDQILFSEKYWAFFIYKTIFIIKDCKTKQIKISVTDKTELTILSNYFEKSEAHINYESRILSNVLNFHLNAGADVADLNS